MCGLSGAMSSNLSAFEVDRFRSLMLLSVLRGTEGAGTIFVNTSNKGTTVKTLKTPYTASDLVFSEAKFDEMLKPNVDILIGHARAPTRGGTDIKNVHPHRSGHITGVHNGTMQNVMGVLCGAEKSDSRMIFEAIATHGVEEFVANSSGAYCLVWTDTKEGTLNFLRNSERPLWFGWSQYSPNAAVTTLYWSSERGMLSYTLNRSVSNNTSLKYAELPPDTHVQYSLAVKTGGLRILGTKEIKAPIKKSVSHYYGGMWDCDYDDVTEPKGDVIPFDAPFQRQLALPSPTATYHGPRRTVEQIFSPSQTPSNILAQRRKEREAEKYVGAGACVYCDDTPSAKDGKPPKIYPVKTGSGHPQYLCEDCFTNPALADLHSLAHATLQ